MKTRRLSSRPSEPMASRMRTIGSGGDNPRLSSSCVAMAARITLSGRPGVNKSHTEGDIHLIGPLSAGSAGLHRQVWVGRPFG